MDALAIACQIAEALDAAQLRPSNGRQSGLV
jgi:hypothetical protein